MCPLENIHAHTCTINKQTDSVLNVCVYGCEGKGVSFMRPIKINYACIITKYHLKMLLINPINTRLHCRGGEWLMPYSNGNIKNLQATTRRKTKKLQVLLCICYYYCCWFIGKKKQYNPTFENPDENNRKVAGLFSAVRR